MIKAIFLDVDGTIFVPGEAGIRDSVLSEIRNAQRHGIRVFIASGRPSSALPPFLEAVHADGFILAGGAQVHIGDLHADRFLPESAIRDVCGILDREKISYSIQTDSVTYNVRDMLDYYVPYGIRTKEFDGDPEAYRRTLKIEFKLSPCDIRRIDGFPEVLRVEEHPDGVSMEFNDPGCSKGKAILQAVDLLGISLPETAAFGDSVNDIDMLETAGIGVAMANAMEDVRRAADIIAPPVTEDGAAVVLRQLLAKKEHHNT